MFQKFLLLFMLVWKSTCFDQCTTVFNEPGQCVQVKHCSIFQDHLTSIGKQKLPSDFYGKLSESICGFIKFESYICCAGRHITVYQPPIINNGGGVLIFAKDKKGATMPTTNKEPQMSSITSANLIQLTNDQCGFTNSDKISNANITELNEYPWMALLRYETTSGLEFKCAGSLISKLYVLTAAHCVQTSDKLVSVRLGEHDISTDRDCDEFDYCAPPVQDIGIAELITHENYKRRVFRHDIALIRLKDEANLNRENVKLICLPPQSEEGHDPEIAIVAGWGYTEKRNMISNQLQQAQVPVKTINECQEYYKANIQLNNSEVCAGGSNFVHTCYGDSGGPLFYPLTFGNILVPRFVQLGIVSAGYVKCGEIDSYTIYTRVSLYTNWILDTMKP